MREEVQKGLLLVVGSCGVRFFTWWESQEFILVGPTRLLPPALAEIIRLKNTRCTQRFPGVPDIISLDPLGNSDPISTWINHLPWVSHPSRGCDFLFCLFVQRLEEPRMAQLFSGPVIAG